MKQPVRATDLEAALALAFAGAAISVRDDSAQHAGHAGAREGGHFHVRIESPRFEGMARLARHRLVYDALAGLIQGGIHALSIEALNVSKQDQR